MDKKTKYKYIRFQIIYELNKYAPDEKKLQELGMLLGDPNEKDRDIDRLVRKEIAKKGISFEEYMELKEQEFTDRDIVKITGMSQSTLARRKRDWGVLIEVNYFKCTKEEYLSHREKGLSTYAISKMMGCNMNTLYKWVRKWGLK